MVEKAEDFIGWKSKDGKLEVIGIKGKDNNGRSLFKVTCVECCKDKELFPIGHFVSLKDNLKKGQIPCGCAKSPRWNQEQFLVLARRAAKGRFIVHGFNEEFHGQNTKLACECVIDGHFWYPRINNVLKYQGCPKCGKRPNITEEEAISNCESICEKEGYTFLGFPSGYRNNRSRLEYLCDLHGIQNINYNHFVNSGKRCKYCKIEESAERLKIPEDQALSNCVSICIENNYTPIGFDTGYKNNKTIFKYLCPIHGERTVTYNSFVNRGSRCGACAKDEVSFNGYYPNRKDEVDYLYILNFDDKFIKVGRSFNIDKRINTLKSASGIDNISKLQIFTSTHKDIYCTEQALIKQLRHAGFQLNLTWTRGCFNNRCYTDLQRMILNISPDEVIF